MMPAVFAAFLVALAVTILQSGSARAADNCIAAPNSESPQGSHWYYRIDRVKQRKCWYLRPWGQKVRSAEPQVKPAKRILAPVGAETAGDGLIPPTQVEQPSPEIPLATTGSVRTQSFEQQGAAISAPAVQDHTLQGHTLTEAHVIDAHDAAQGRQPVAATTTEMSDTTTVPFRRMLVLFASTLVTAGILHRFAARHIEKSATNSPTRYLDYPI
jgi:hypothetical protein